MNQILNALERASVIEMIERPNRRERRRAAALAALGAGNGNAYRITATVKAPEAVVVRRGNGVRIVKGGVR